MAYSVIDISRYQGKPNWTAVKEAGVHAVIIEYKDEIGTPNPLFTEQWQGARGVGLGTGAYVFCRPDQPAEPQVADIRALMEIGPVWADIELTPVTDEWLGAIRATGCSGYVPGYMPFSAFGPWPWVTDYEGTYLEQVGTGTVPGIDGEVDLDIWRGTWTELAACFRLSVTAPPDPPIEHGEQVVAIVSRLDRSEKQYWLATAAGNVYAFGGAPFLGSLKGRKLSAPIVGMATSRGKGYYLVGADGGVFAFGESKYSGSVPSLLARTKGQRAIATNNTATA